jgi:cell division protein FtsI (penicillin-binding protein 3)
LAELPAFDAGQREDLESSMKWLGIKWLSDQSKESEWGILSAKSADSLILVSRIVSDKLVPSVVGMGLKDAVYLLENRGCKVRIQGVGRVVRQSVAPGTRANGRTPVLLQLE